MDQCGSVQVGEASSRVRALDEESLTWVLRLPWSPSLLESQLLSHMYQKNNTLPVCFTNGLMRVNVFCRLEGALEMLSGIIISTVITTNDFSLKTPVA